MHRGVRALSKGEGKSRPKWSREQAGSHVQQVFGFEQLLAAYHRQCRWSEGTGQQGQQKSITSKKGKKGRGPLCFRPFIYFQRGVVMSPDWPGGIQVWSGRGMRSQRGVVLQLTHLINYILSACLHQNHTRLVLS